MSSNWQTVRTNRNTYACMYNIILYDVRTYADTNV